jgi:GNAT superfamily N-acetyltransferase
MECTAFLSERMADLTELINAHMAQMPPGWTITECRVAQVLNTPSLWSMHYPGEAGNFEAETLCVVDGRCLVAAAQLCYPMQYSAESSSGFISWIIAVPGRVKALSLLLDALVTRCREQGCCALDTSRYAFGVGWMGIPVVWPHLVAGFERAGFSCTQHWVMMTGSTDVHTVAMPESVASMHLDWKMDETALEWDLRLCDGELLVGECQAWGIPPHLADCDGYTDWITYEWLGVESPYQGRGIGRWLLAEHLRRQARRGVKRAIFWTETDNRAMRRVGESLGFDYGPECRVFVRIVE